MKPSELMRLIESLRSVTGSKRPVLVESSPGLGKTQIASQVAAKLGIGFKAIHAPLMQPEDYGMPVVYGKDRDQLKFIVSSEKFPLEGSDCPQDGILLIDELSQADTAGQKILANLIQEREIHGYRLKPGWTIIATGNREEDQAGANRILGHLANRLTRVELEPDLDDWTNWALSNNVKPEIVAFIRMCPGFLSSYDPRLRINATPRSWVEGVSARLGVISKDLELATFSGDVGEGPATELLAFLKVCRNIPNPDRILLNPETEPVPSDDPSATYAIIGALVARVNESNFGRIMKYINRLPPEFGVLFCKLASAACPDVVMTEDFIRWATKDGASLIS